MQKQCRKVPQLGDHVVSSWFRDAFYLSSNSCIRRFMASVLIIMCSLLAVAQTKTVTGVVKDAENEPVIGATVKVLGSAAGMATGLDGTFSVPAEKGDAIEVSFIGYKAVTFKVTDKASYTVTLFEDSQTLNEIIVTGYGAVAKKNLTTSISKVKADDVNKTALSNMSQMLVGRAAGLQATLKSAQPGGGISLTVRGGGEPIYVVDGMVMPSTSLEGASGGTMTTLPSNVNRSGLAGINPEDIESIEVLKDASASIYGIGAANGVILVTTKKGVEGRIKVSYNGSFSAVRNYGYLDMLNGNEYMNYVNAFGKELYLYNHKMGLYGGTSYDGGFDPSFGDSQIAAATTTNWRDLILKNGSISNHNITIQGGSKVLTYYASGNYYKQDGTVANSDFERYTLRTNIGAQLTKFLKLSTAVNVNRNVNNNGSVGGTGSGRGPEASGSLAAALTYPTNLPVRDENDEYTIFKFVPNAASMLDILDRSQTTGFAVNFTADVDIVKQMLTARFLFGYNNENSERSIYIPSDVYFDQKRLSRGNITRNERYNTTLEGTINFNKDFSSAFGMDAVVGMGRYLNKYTGLSVGYNKINDVIGNDNIGAAEGDIMPGSSHAEDEKRSQFARATFRFFDRYIISGSLRRDGTDKFFKGKKYAFFPSVSVAWKIYDEAFMRDITWINMLKLRASYGTTGNDNLGSTLYGTYSFSNNYVKFNNNGTSYIPFYLKSQDYPDVTWEKTVMKNIGLDFSFLNDRINGSFDYFWNDITNMLGWANTNALSMFSSYPINGGHIRRYGWDATINTTNIAIHNFRWTSVLTLSHYNSIWKERMPNYDFNEYQKQKDEPVNALYFYRTDGIINAEMSNVPAHQPEALRLPGCPVLKDLNGDGKLDTEDIELVNVTPKLYWGFGNTFIYKNWSLDVFLYSQLGLKKHNYIYDWTSASELASQNSNQSVYMKDVWHSELNPNGTLPGVAWTQANVTLPGGAGTDIGYENSSFVRVRNITLGYQFERNNLGLFGKYVSGLRLYVDVQNPFTFTSFKGFDPEVVTGGGYKGGKAEYPMTRTYSVGLNLTL